MFKEENKMLANKEYSSPVVPQSLETQQLHRAQMPVI